MTQTAVQLPLPGFEQSQGEWRAAYLQQMPAAPQGQSLEEMRANVERFSGLLPRRPVQIAGTRDLTLPGPAGDLAARVYTPFGDGPFGALVFFRALQGFPLCSGAMPHTSAVLNAMRWPCPSLTWPCCCGCSCGADGRLPCCSRSPPWTCTNVSVHSRSWVFLW